MSNSMMESMAHNMRMQGSGPVTVSGDESSMEESMSHNIRMRGDRKADVVGEKDQPSKKNATDE